MAGERVEILGVDFDPITTQQAVARALSFVEDGTPHQIWTASITHLMLCRRDQEFAQLIPRADLVVPDGMPVVWMSRLNRTPLPERVTGADLMPALCEAAAKRGLSVFFLGGEPGVPEEVACRLSRQYPGLVVAGTYSPPMYFESDPDENEKAIRRVVETHPHFLFVSLGTPRQEKWINQNRHRLGVPVMMGVGAAFNFISGRERRAPRWLREMGLESLWRITQRPVEILRRLIRNAPPFFLLMLDRRTYRSQKSLLVRARPVVLACLDAVVAAGGFVLAYASYFRILMPSKDPYPGLPISQVPAYSTLVPFVVIINFLAMLGTDMYRRLPRGSYRRLLRRTAVSAATTLILLITFTFACKEIFEPDLRGYSRGVFGLFGLLNFAGLLAIRSVLRYVEGILHVRGLVADWIILIGKRSECERFAIPLMDRRGQGQWPVGRIRRAGEPPADNPVIPELGTVSDLRKIVAARKIDEVVIVDLDLSPEELVTVVRVCGEFRVRLSYLPNIPKALEARFRIREVGGRRVLSVDGRDLHRASDAR